MPDANDLLEVSVGYEFHDQQAANVFKYINLGVNVSIGETVTTFINNLVPALADVMSDNALINAVGVRNLFDPSEGQVDTISVPGNRSTAGDDSPTFVALGFDLFHDDQSVNSGKKRVGGLIEEVIDTNGELTVPFQSIADATAATFTQAFLSSATNDGLFVPVVPGSVLITEGVYRLPETYTEMLANGVGFVTSASPGRVTTQNSRKGW